MSPTALAETQESQENEHNNVVIHSGSSSNTDERRSSDDTDDAKAIQPTTLAEPEASNSSPQPQAKNFETPPEPEDKHKLETPLPPSIGPTPRTSSQVTTVEMEDPESSSDPTAETSLNNPPTLSFPRMSSFGTYIDTNANKHRDTHGDQEAGQIPAHRVTLSIDVDELNFAFQRDRSG